MGQQVKWDIGKFRNKENYYSRMKKIWEGFAYWKWKFVIFNYFFKLLVGRELFEWKNNQHSYRSI